MAKHRGNPKQFGPGRKPVAWLHGEVKTSSFSSEGRKEAGDLLRLLQEGETLGMPHAEALPIIGRRCGALRIRDVEHNWRIVFRTDADVVLVLEVYDKKTRAIPDEVIDRCQKRLNQYDSITKASRKSQRGTPKHRKP